MYIAKVRLLERKYYSVLQRASFFQKGSELPQDVMDRILNYLLTNCDIKRAQVMKERDIPRLLKKIHRLD
jgi:hypothetical protein